MKNETSTANETVETKTNKANKAELKKTTSTKPRIYLGPSLKGVNTGTVYIDELPPALQEAIRTEPVIKELVVPVSEITNCTREIAMPNSALSRFYAKAEKYRKGE